MYELVHNYSTFTYELIRMGLNQSMCCDFWQLINLNVFDFPHLCLLVLGGVFHTKVKGSVNNSGWYLYRCALWIFSTPTTPDFPLCTENTYFYHASLFFKACFCPQFVWFLLSTLVGACLCWILACLLTD